MLFGLRAARVKRVACCWSREVLNLYMIISVNPWIKCLMMNDLCYVDDYVLTWYYLVK